MRVALGLLALAAPPASAQEIDVGGELGTTAGVRFDADNTILSLTELELDVSGEVGLGVFPDASFVTTLYSGYDATNLDNTRVELGEAYATLFLGDLDLSVGQQTVAWGSADGFNPVDVINPRDLSRGLVAAEKLPVPIIRAVYNAPGGVKVDAVVVPAFRPSRLPALTLPAPGQPVPGQPAQPPELPPGATLPPPDDRRAASTPENIQAGLRATLPLDVLGGGDVSATYVHGIATEPTFSVGAAPVAPQQGPPGGAAPPVLTYTEYDLFGLDFSLAALGTVFHGEAAYTLTADHDGTDPAVDNHSFQGVFGGEYTFSGGLTTSLQGIVDYLAADSGSEVAWDFSTALVLRYEVNTRTNLEALWLQNITDGSGVVAPEISYTFTDSVTGELGAGVLYGADDTQFGALRDTSQLTLGLSYAF